MKTTDMKHMTRFGFSAVSSTAIAMAAVLFGCATPSRQCDDRPLVAAVFVDAGARNIGAFRWLEIAAMSPQLEPMPVDGESVRSGALDRADLFIMPGGSSVKEASMLGEEGRRRLKEFIARGGGYVGTCAGCCMLMQPTKGHPNMLGILPWKFGPAGGHADILVEFNGKARSIAGIKPGARRIRYSGGPVPVKADDAETGGADVAVVATYASDINSESSSKRPPFTGKPAAFAGTYGKGRFFATTVHPEVDVDDHIVLKKALSYVTGREIGWECPQRKRGQLAVGFVCDNSFGVDTAKFIADTVASGEFDIIPVNAKEIADGALHGLDAVLSPDSAKNGANADKGLFAPENISRAKAFSGRGGKIIAWGASLEARAVRKGKVEVEKAGNGAEALEKLREFAKEPPRDVPAPPAKVEKPVKVAVYTDAGGANYTVTSILRFSPEYDVTFLDAADFRKGELSKFDLLLQPGGGSTTQYKTLGEKGAAAIADFVRGGGAYYGICAGAFLATQRTSGDRPRIGLCPFRNDVPEHYRGWGPVVVRLTDEGHEIFPGNMLRNMIYWGGPVLVPGDPVEDSDVKVFGRYDGRLVNTCSSKPVKEMYGKAAFVGGRVGKGKIFLSCPHPEKNESNRDIVLGILEYLTGVRPTVTDREKRRGSINVLFKTGRTKEAAGFYLDDLIVDSRFFTRSGSSVDPNALAHVDAIIFASCNPDEITPAVVRFAERGGKVVVVAKAGDKRAVAAAGKCPGAVVADSFDAVIPELLK